VRIASLPWIIDGSFKGGEGDMLQEVEKFLEATFFVGGEDSHCLRLDISLWGSIHCLGDGLSLGRRGCNEKQGHTHKPSKSIQLKKKICRHSNVLNLY
jgi:hypothetical protein